MRSRYTAYVLKNSEYLLKTWHPKKRPVSIDFSNEPASWQRLEIIAIQKGGINDQVGIVEFKAYYFLDGIEHTMKEISRFKKDKNAWFYLDGKVKSIATKGGPSNQGLNAPCACGSGKKFKRCCGKNQN
jgi:SEC-C motif-containing protein